MNFMITTLCQNVLYFIRNYYSKIFKIILIATLIQISINYILAPQKEELIFIKDFFDMNFQEIIEKLSTDQQLILIKLSIANSFSVLISNTFLCGGILTMLNLISKFNYDPNIPNIVRESFPKFPKLLLLIFLTNLSVQLGFMLAVLPGIILAIIMSLTPILIVTHHISIKNAIFTSIKLTIKNAHLTIPAIIMWLFIQTILILIFIKHVDIYQLINKFILNYISNTSSSILLIYLYRLYMTIQKI